MKRNRIIALMLILTFACSFIFTDYNAAFASDEPSVETELNGAIQKTDSKGKVHWYYYKDNVKQTGTKWISEDGVKSYYLKKGQLVTGWLSYNNKAYYFDDQAKRLYNATVPNTEIFIGEDGCLNGNVGKAYAYAIKRLNKYGWTLKMALKSARRIHFYDKKYRPKSVIAGVLYAIKNNKGNCYVRHCLFKVETMLLGYECRIIKGTVGSKKAPHSWAEVKLDDKWWVFDATTYSPWTKGYKIFYGKKGTYKYNRVSKYLKFQ